MLTTFDMGAEDVLINHWCGTRLTQALKSEGVCAGKWKQKFIALHMYDSNAAAKLLYKSAGYRELASIKPFMERRRVLMCKNL